MCAAMPPVGGASLSRSGSVSWLMQVCGPSGVGAGGGGEPGGRLGGETGGLCDGEIGNLRRAMRRAGGLRGERGVGEWGGEDTGGDGWENLAMASSRAFWSCCFFQAARAALPPTMERMCLTPCQEGAYVA